MGCEGSKMQRTNEPVGTLHYFDVYSRGEQIRLLLSHANVNYTDRRIQIADWPNIKPTMPGNQHSFKPYTKQGQPTMPPTNKQVNTSDYDNLDEDNIDISVHLNIGSAFLLGTCYFLPFLNRKITCLNDYWSDHIESFKKEKSFVTTT